MNLLPSIDIYTQAIFETGRQPAFVMMLAFLVTFAITRAYTRIARHTGWGSASFGGVHTHHMVFGLVMALVAAALQFAFMPALDSGYNLLLALIFGSGAALVLDEFALIFHLKDVYWEKEGRKSVDAVVIGLLLGVLFLLHVAPFASAFENATGYLIFLTLIINLFFVIVAALKGKFTLATFGVFIPFIAEIGALRLAEPDSIWARKFYVTKQKKQRRSVKRYARYEARWRPRKEWFWDLIGGKTGRPPAR